MKSLKVILKEDVKGLGKKGQTVDVADGYGRNYLLPKGLAVPASSGTLREVGLVRASREKKEERLREEASGLAARMKEMQFAVKAKAGEGGKLYGAITNIQVAQELERRLGAKIDKRKVILPEPIKTLGNYQVEVRLYPGVVAEIKVEVVSD